MTAQEIYDAEDVAYRAMMAAVLDYDGTGYDGIESAYQDLRKYIEACPDNPTRAAALSALTLTRMRAKGYIDTDIRSDAREAASVYHDAYLAIIRDGLRDARMLAVASLYE